MKRKLFTLLAAFMALAAFQANADGVAPYDGQTLHYLNVWTAGQQRAGHGVGDCFVDTYPSSIGVIHEVAKDYPLSADSAQTAAGVKTGKALHAMKYVFNRNFNKWELTNSNRLGSVGDVDTYFTLEANTGTKSNTYTIRSKSPNVVNDAGNRIFFTASDGYTANEFTFLRFVTENGDEYDGVNATANAATVKDSVGMVPWTTKYVKPRDGGYLATDRLPGRSAGGDNDRNLYVVAYDTTLNVNLAPNNRYALYSMDEVRKNWEKIANGQKVVRIVPVWVKADAIGGRWATTNDFPDEFVKFPIQPQGSTANYFTVGGVSIFNVTKSGALNFNQYGSNNSNVTGVSHPVANDMLEGDNKATTSATGDSSRLYKNASNKWELQYFKISDPCTGNLLMVDRQSALPAGMYNGDGKFGNKLTMKPWFTTATNSGYTGATLDELQRTQQFAIWINENGNMELYPLNSWTRAYSDNAYRTSAPTSPCFNYAVWMDRPYASTLVDNAENFNNSFKICQYNNNNCTGMVSGNSSGYVNLELRPEKANLINKVTENRYYFIQVEPKTNFYAWTADGAKKMTGDSIYVLDLVKTINGQKRVVLTPMEKDRYTGTEGRYFDTPYDSVNMSAHWRFAHVEGGYVIINQLGDTLEYDYDAPSLNVSDLQSAYIKDKAPSRAKSYKSDVWQTVHLDCFNGYFKLRNMAETPYGVEKPWLNQPYLDTLKHTATSTANNAALWYQGFRGRAASASVGTYPYYTNQLQKDVFLADGASNGGLKMKLRAVDYEFAPGGDSNTRTNHSDDGYFPSDDSLCVYLYKEGNYNITEALSLALHIKEGYTGDDPVNGINLATFTRDNSSKWLRTEPVISNENPNLADYRYMTPMTYLDTTGARQLNVDYSLTTVQMNAAKASANAQVVEMLKTEGFNVDSYKWHYIKNLKGEYLVYDTINTKTTLPTQQFGFKFRAVDRTNATMFRFYQPLVADKSTENFIMEFRVAKHEYAVDRRSSAPSVRVINGRDNIYSTDNFGINPYVTTAGLTSPTNSTTLAPGNPTPDYPQLVADVYAAGTDMSTWAPSLVERYFKYLNYERAIRTKYALISTGSDMLLSTWNAGSDKGATGQLAATRFKFTGVDETICKKDYVDTKYLLETQLYANPTVKAAMMDVFVSADTPTGDSIATKAKDANNKTYADNNTTALKLLITLADTLKVGTTPGVNGYLKTFKGTSAAFSKYNYYENTREVEFYYIQNAIDTTLYLTVDSTSVYAETMGSTSDGVSGMKLTWSKRYNGKSQNGSTVGEAADYRPLQMFAIYGCKNTTMPFGNFILIPAASWEYNYNTKTHTRIVPNTKVGNNIVNDEFRIGDFYKKNVGDYMIVMPSSSETTTEGITPSEYKFTREAYYAGDYFCQKESGHVVKHSFIQGQGFTPNAKAAGLFIHSYKIGDSKSVKDYNDPSQHWSICKNPNGTYTFTPESDMWDANGEKVPTRNQLTKQYYLVPMNVNNYAIGQFTANQFGETPQLFMAIPTDYPNRDNIITLTVTRMSETEEDECTTAFKKFETEDLYLDWGIIESVYTDRYLYSHGEADGAGYADDPAYPGKAGDWADAYYKDADDNAAKTVEFLRLRESNTTYQNEKNGDTVFHHAVPYYNIIHVVYNTETKQEDEYYLEMGYDEKFKKDVVRFRHLTDREKYVVENYKNYPDTMQAVKFCFPYKLNLKGQPTTTVKVNGQDYTDKNVAIRTMPRQNEVFWLGVGSPNTSEALAVKDSTKADVFFFGPNANTGEEWIGDKTKTGWLKDFSRSNASSIYLVEPSAETPNYGLLSYYKDVLPTINDGKFTFKMVKDTIINKYTKTHIWYYQIINDKGQLLTYKPLAGAASDYKYGEYTYAYFTDSLPKAHVVTPTNNQVFGLLINKAAATSGHSYPFWVVAQAPSGSYKYLGQYNNRMVFIPTVSDKKKEAQEKAMTFEIGKMSGDTFTGKENIDGGAAAVYGVEGAVKVVNAAGTIELFTIDGRQFKAVTATGGEQTITAPRGVVIVKVAGKATKVVVK